MSAVSPRTDEWHIKGVSQETRRKIKIFAVSRGLTLAEALELMADAALARSADDLGNQKQSGTAWLKSNPDSAEIVRPLKLKP